MQETHEYTPPQFGYEPSALYPMLENDIRAAALSFPPNTGHGADGLAPRSIARLSSQALQALIALFLAFEASGSWCQAVNMVLIVLLPKRDGGRRPIGLFPTIVRIWMRVRISIARQWERAHDHDSLFAGPDMGAQKASWQEAFAAESASLAGLDYAQALLDLVKAFETMPHWVLTEAAKIKGYPIAQPGCVQTRPIHRSRRRVLQTHCCDQRHHRWLWLRHVRT